MADAVPSEIEDCTLPWTFAENSTDYIHMRFLFGSIADWDALFADAYRTCKPGGWLESHEASAIARSDHEEIPDSAAISQWTKFFVEGGRKTGRLFTVVDDGLQRKAMEKAGFVDIQEHNWKVRGLRVSITRNMFLGWRMMTGLTVRLHRGLSVLGPRTRF